GVTFMMWARWTLPRLRIDQVMTTCLKYCTPIAAFGFLGAVLWTYYLPGGLFLGNNYGHVREAHMILPQYPPAEAPAAVTAETPPAKGAAAGAPASALSQQEARRGND